MGICRCKPTKTFSCVLLMPCPILNWLTFRKLRPPGAPSEQLARQNAAAHARLSAIADSSRAGSRRARCFPRLYSDPLLPCDLQLGVGSVKKKV